MSLGWAPNDILILARLAYEIFSFCQNAPAELQGLFNKLEKIGRKLEQFSTVLEKSGLGTWQQAPALKQNLLDIKAYLEPLRPDNNNGTSIPSKAKRLARLALNQDKLRRIEKTLDENERDINDMKIDLILACSLRNLQYGLDPRSSPKPPNEILHLLDKPLPVIKTAPTVPLSSESDRSSIASTTVSNASKALVMAMALTTQPIKDAGAVTTRDITAENSLRDVKLAKDFITEVVSLAEETELYSKDADPIQNLEQLTEITEKATHLLALRPSNVDSRSSVGQYELPAVGELGPDSFERGIWGDLCSISDNSSMRRWALSRSLARSSHNSVTHLATPSTTCSGPTPPNQMPLQNPPGYEDDIFQMDITSMIDAITRQLDNEPSNKKPISLLGRSEVSLNMNSKVSMACSFHFEAFEGSARLEVTSTNKSHFASDAVFASGALPSTASSSSSSSSQFMNDKVLPRPPETFQHCFQLQARPIPHFLHPDVEGPTEEPNAPYTITFTERQYISEEHPSKSPRWTTSLMYIFYEKQDRMTLCEKIFGKTLVTTAGSNKITYGGQELSHMSAIALWLDSASGTKSVTFSPNFTGQKTARKDIELMIHGLWDAKKALRNSNVLSIVAESMSTIDEDTFDGSSIKSGATRFSRASTSTFSKWKKSGKLKCTIEFSQLSDRMLFLSHLYRYNSG